MIRPATPGDLPEIMPLFEKARKFMCRMGNPHQWIDGYPSEAIIGKDIINHNFYVEETEGGITGAFALIIGNEPTYRTILGNWINENPYGTIHRLVSDGTQKGFTERCIRFCMKLIPNLRADTHRDNVPMQKALLRNSFRYCGIIHVANGSERLAYQLAASINS